MRKTDAGEFTQQVDERATGTESPSIFDERQTPTDGLSVSHSRLSVSFDPDSESNDMLIALFQVLFAAMRTVSRSAVNIMLYSLLSRIFNQWFGFNSLISFVCSAFCLSKIVSYFKRLWLNARLKNKKPNERIVLSELTWQSPTTQSNKSDSISFYPQCPTCEKRRCSCL